MRARTVFVLFSLASIGCTALIGVRDLHYDESADGGIDGGASSSSSSSGSTSDGGGLDGATCNANLDTDSKNCGRCGRDCLEGTCNAGKCTPIPLASTLLNPTSAVPYKESLVVTSYGNGKILLVSKKPGQAVTEIKTGLTSPWGAVVDGDTLYFADSDFPYDDAGTYNGGIWKCDLPACATPSLVTNANQPSNPVLVNGVLYFAEYNADQITRVSPNGTGLAVVDTTSNPHSVAVDNSYVYYTSSQPTFWRVALSPPDAAAQAAGPQGYFAPGTVVLDDQRYYYTYTDDGEQEAGAGHVLSFSKATPNLDKIEYGGGNVVPRGIVVDDQYVYWVNSGHFDEVSGAPTKYDGDVSACPKAGCGPTGPIVLATGLGRPWEMSQDANAIYVCVYGNYLESSGSILKIPKL